jgi:hypothetical protein
VEHISDHDLERCYLGVIPHDGPEEAELEEHLLWCQECVARAGKSGRYVGAIRAGIIGGKPDLT